MPFNTSFVRKSLAGGVGAGRRVRPNHVSGGMSVPDLWLIGAGPMAMAYAAVLDDLGVEYAVVGRGERSAAAFTSATGVTAERKTVSGTVNQYTLASWTHGGTSPEFTFMVGFARG